MRNKTRFLFLVLLSAAIASARAQSSFRDFTDSVDATMDAVRESREQNAAASDVRAIFARAKAAAEAILSGMVQIPGKDYKMGKTEVTQAQWEAVMGENPSRFKGSDNPVEQVSWDDCQQFLSVLNSIPAVQESGLTFRLPTEEEWEYACCAGATGVYCKLANGTEITKDTLGQVAWFEDNASSKTHPVGQKEPNAFGLYDMHGNVWEWTSTADGEDRVFRGGGWGLSARSCESSFRLRCSSSYRFNCLGFRLCASGRAD